MIYLLPWDNNNKINDLCFRRELNDNSIYADIYYIPQYLEWTFNIFAHNFAVGYFKTKEAAISACDEKLTELGCYLINGNEIEKFERYKILI